MKQLGILEGILFIVGDEGISLKNIASTMNLSETEVKDLLNKLKITYENQDRGLKICYLGDAFKLTTKSEHKEYYQKLVDDPVNNGLSPAALETLAIIAYNGPLTKLEIDEMRGVNNFQMLRRLTARGLVCISGKSNLPGKPNLYRVTNEFLDYFGLATFEDLPKFENIKSDNEEIDN